MEKALGIIGVKAKTLYRYWIGHPFSVGVADPNVVVVLIIKAEKCTQNDIICEVMINDNLPYLVFLYV